MGKILIVTGLSGAGKTQALKSLEDMGYYCIDNLPVEIVDKFVSLIFDEKFNKTAIGIDIRQEGDFDILKKLFSTWKKRKQEYKMLFLDASKNVLVGRYKATKRKHPLEGKHNLLEAIDLEKGKTEWLKKSSDYVICTDKYTNYDLKKKIEKTVKVTDKTMMDVELISFGYSYGIPTDADLVFDVRFLPNPFYVENLRHYNGKNIQIKKYIESDKNSKKSMDKLLDFIKYLLPLYEKEGKSKTVIAFGCTGGKHRSVYSIERAKEIIVKMGKYNITVEHRDLK